MDENMFDLGLNIASLLDGPVPEPIITLSGGDDYTVPDAADYPLLALSLYGKSTQGYASHGGTPLGKNLLDLVATTATYNGVTFTNNGDGTYTLNGTATGGAAAFQFNIISSLPNLIGKDVIINGCPKGGSNTTYALQSFVEGFASHKFDWGSGVEVTNWEENRTILRITVASGATVENLTFKPMIRLASVSDGTYEQYKGTPNPNYPVPIESSWNNGLNLVVKGEEDIQVVSWRTQGEVITQQPQSAVCRIGDTVKFSVSGGTSYQWQQDTSGNGVFTNIDTVTGRSKSFNITGAAFHDGYKYRCVVTDSSGNSEISNPATLYVMSEDWGGTSGSISALDLDTPLRSVGDYHDSREYTYNGEIKGIKRIVELNKPTVNSVSTYITPEGDTAYRISLVKEPGLLPNVELLCNILAYNSNWNTLYTLCAPTEIIRFQLPLSELDDGSKEAAQSWVNEHNMTIYYPLAEPGEFELSPEEVESLSSLRSYEETTNIYNNAQIEMFVRVLRREFDMKYIEWLKESQTWVCPKGGKWKVIAVGGGAGGNFSFSLTKKGALALTSNGGTTSFGSIVSALGGVISEDSVPGAQAELISGQSGYNGMSIGGSGVAMKNSVAVSLNKNCGLSTDGEGYGASGGCIGTTVRFSSNASSGNSDITAYPISTPHGQIESTIVDLIEGQSVICTIGKGGKPSTTAERIVAAAKIHTTGVSGITEENLSLALGLAHPGRDGVIVVQYLGY